MNVLIVIGTRPEAIKMAPLVFELRKNNVFNVKICNTGQQEQLVGQALSLFGLSADYDLRIMKEQQSLYDITVSILERIRNVFRESKPDIVCVHGDTTTAFTAALASYYEKIPVAHVEAGLRTYDLFSPYPEEFNRRAIDLISKYHFSPTNNCKKNLLNEGITENIYVTGNTIIDVLKNHTTTDKPSPELTWASNSKLIVLTLHRRENIGQPMRSILHTMHRIADEFKEVRILFPVHNPLVRNAALDEFAYCERIRIVDPINLFDFYEILKQCNFIVTDSGGIQEEASFLGKPIVVTRNKTERKEDLLERNMKLVGSDVELLYETCRHLLVDSSLYEQMSLPSNIFGDGFASERIANILLQVVNNRT